MLCRLCLINEENCGVFLFDAYKSNGDYMVVQLIAKYLHLLVAHNDAISTAICQKCFGYLETFHKFSAHVERQQSTMRNQFVEVDHMPFPATQAGTCTIHEQENEVVDCMPAQQNPLEAQVKFEAEESGFITESIVAYNDNHVMEDPIPPGHFDHSMKQKIQNYENKGLTTCLSTAVDDTSASANSNPSYGMSKLLFSQSFYRVIKQLDSTLFEQHRGGALIQCCICKRKLKGSIQVTSNLIRHLKVRHPDAFEEYKRMKSDKQKHVKVTVKAHSMIPPDNFGRSMEQTNQDNANTYSTTDLPAAVDDTNNGLEDEESGCTPAQQNPLEFQVKYEIEERFITDSKAAYNDNHSIEDLIPPGNFEHSMEQTSQEYENTVFTVDFSEAGDDASVCQKESKSSYGMSKLLFSHKFFRVINQLYSTSFEQHRGGALFQCCICECKLKGSIQVTSNLIRHLKLKHPSSFEEYKRMKSEKQNHSKPAADNHLMKYSIPPVNYDQDMKQTSQDCANKGLTSDLSIAVGDTSASANSSPSNVMSKLLFSHSFFKVIKQLDSTLFEQHHGGALIQCCICDSKLKGSTQVTSNLLRHLKLKHPDSFEQYKTMKTDKHNNSKARRLHKNFKRVLV